MSIKQYADFIQEAYKTLRKGRLYGYILNKSKSNDLCAIYENKNNIILAIHGASNFSLTLEALTRFIHSSRGSLGLRDVKNALNYLSKQRKRIIVASHSLGGHLFTQARLSIKISNYIHYALAPYSPNAFNRITLSLARDINSYKYVGVEDKLVNSILFVKGGVNINKYQSLNPIVNIRSRNFHSLSIWQTDFHKYKVK